MILLDSNIFIYLAQGTINPITIANHDIAYASITKIECLGFGLIPANELLLLEALFKEAHSVPLTDNIVDCAVIFRQKKPMSLGDSIVAATSLITKSPLWTTNVDDFKHILDLEVVNPLASYS